MARGQSRGVRHAYTRCLHRRHSAGRGDRAGSAQDQRLPGDNYVNHVGFAVENFDEAFNFYTQKMGFREAFTVKDAAGKPQLAYVQVNRNTFVEIQQANANRRPGLNHFGLHVEDLKARRRLAQRHAA